MGDCFGEPDQHGLGSFLGCASEINDLDCSGKSWKQTCNLAALRAQHPALNIGGFTEPCFSVRSLNEPTEKSVKTCSRDMSTEGSGDSSCLLAPMLMFQSDSCMSAAIFR